MSSVPRLLPFSRNCTPVTATLSDALAVTVTVPLSVEPVDGDESETEGGEVSERRGGGEPPDMIVALDKNPVADNPLFKSE